ncbi:hypothetical protein O181_007312 [Austropuccinia psidii MF-1]|uniref:Uncharacterized protein n=1 Tax=Austropuccinia psidii MF-1 TaxID=1389203 RepID=A0A9Q3BMH6_9BASI|nr:hypothetical protein [Austropuccinia psidii MF-1]
MVMRLHRPPDVTPTLPPSPPSHCLPSLRFFSAVKMRLICRPPISTLTTPHASAPPPHLLLHLPSLGSSNAALNPPYASSHLPNTLFSLKSLNLHSALPTFLGCHPHTGLILNATYNPYAPAAPAR